LRRIALTLLLWAGFWGLGLALGGALLSLPVAELVYQGSVSFPGVLAGLGGVTVLGAIRPRGWFGKAKAGSRQPLRREQVPALAEFVDGVARRAGAVPPDRLAFCDWATAYASTERRWGIPWRREVGIGLPLFAVLGRDELAAVLTHEFGHHLGGDTALGPWVYRTRRSLGGTLFALDESSFFLDVPFRAYGQMFLRVSSQISRETERAADRRAAGAFGAEAMAGALLKTYGLAPLWDVYFESEVVPLLQRGIRVPLLDGFRRFLAEPDRRPDVTRRIDEALHRAPSPWDSHPSLEQRMQELGFGKTARAALQGLDPGGGCLDLLGGERAAEDAWYGLAVNGTPSPMSWDELGDKAILPALRGALTAARLPDPSTTSIASLPGMLASGTALWDRARAGGIDVLSPEAKRQRARRLLTDWLAVSLGARGFEAQVRPGAHLRLRRGGLAVEPAALVERLATGTLEEADYLALCEAVERGEKS
jgi:Zn-dependent protease with chaperone function